MRSVRMLLRALGVERTVVLEVDWENDLDRQALVVRVRPREKDEGRCSQCGKKCPRYDRGGGLRRWRRSDVGLCPSYIEAQAPRVRCRKHGVVVQQVRWARAGSRFTTIFEDQVAWLAVRTDETTLTGRLLIAWTTMGRILECVAASMKGQRDPLANVTRIGIDEVLSRKGHRYLTVVVDHDSGRLLWASPGHDQENLKKFFDLLGPERSTRIWLVSSDAAVWIHNIVHERCLNAWLCLDPSHAVQWAPGALDEVRRSVWNQLRKTGQKERAKTLKGARWAP